MPDQHTSRLHKFVYVSLNKIWLYDNGVRSLAGYKQTQLKYIHKNVSLNDKHQLCLQIPTREHDIR